jgi:uncharacterized protein with PIN domain
MSDKLPELPDDATVKYRLNHDLCIYCGRPLQKVMEPPPDSNSIVYTESYYCNTPGCVFHNILFVRKI